jgi:hypothetical protein
MNCETFRRRVLIDPNDPDPDLQAHARDCLGCAEALRDVLLFEERMREALRTELHAGGLRSSKGTRRSPGLVSLLLLSFSLLLVVLWMGWGGLAQGPGDVYDAEWQELVLGHIREEESHLREREEVPFGRVSLLLGSLGGRLTREIGSVRYAGRCRIGRRDGIHLVLAGENGPVTALFMRGTPLDDRLELRGDGLTGVLVPARFGNLAVVGGRGEPLERLTGRLLGSVEWSE